MGLRAWIISVALHAAALMALLLVLHAPQSLDAKGEDLPSIAIQMASLPPPPPPPPPPPVPAPPIVEQPLPVIESKAPEPDPEPEPPPPPPKPKPVPPKPKPLPPPTKPVETTPQPVTQPPVTTPVQADPQPPRPAVPNPGPSASSSASAASSADAEQAYLAQISLALNKSKEYPRRALLRRLEGTPQLRFVLNRDGSVASVVIHRSSGHELLDEAALETVRRALPLPPFPPELAKNSLDLAVPIEFHIKR